MKNVVATSSGDQYQNGNIKFLMWVYTSNDHRCLLSTKVLDPMGFSDEEFQGGRLTKTHHTAALRKILRVALDIMVRSDPTTSPIMLSNLNFVVFSEYLLSLRRVNKKWKRKKEVAGSRSPPSAQHTD